METREEQIKQASIEWKKANNPVCMGGDAFSDMIDLINVSQEFIAGAEWADAHPQSPWKNVMTDEPKKDQDVFAHVPNLCGGEYCKLTYLGNYRWSQDEGEWTTEFYNNEVMWMPIPEKL